MLRLLLALACVWYSVTGPAVGSSVRTCATRAEIVSAPTALAAAAFPMCAELFRAALGAKSEHTFGEGGARAARGGWGIKIASMFDLDVQGHAQGGTRYEHDPRGYLIRQIFSDGREVHRAADPAGNLFRSAEMNDRVYGKGGVLKRIGSTEVEHDADGNLVKKTLADGAVWQYHWDANGRLMRVHRPDGQDVSFSYDAFGRRLTKSFAGLTTEYIWDGDDLVHERVRQDGETGALTTWVFEPGTFAPLAKIEGRKRFGIVTDHLGTPNVLTTEAGKIAWKAQLDIYGVVREETAGVEAKEATANPWRYPGQYEDAETGLYYNRFRYYDPETGRYISEDPIGLAGGAGLFRYVAAPSTQLDALGLSDADVLTSWAKELSRNPSRGLPSLSHADAQALIDLADETKVKVRASGGDLGLGGKSPNWEPKLGAASVPTPTPHIHIDRHHVPVEPGFTPRGGCR